MTTQDRTYSTKANAKRALAAVCKNCVKHASKIIYETDEGRFALNEDLVEKYMDKDEWNEVYGFPGNGLPTEPTVEEAPVESYITEGMKVQQAVTAAVQKEVTNPLNVPHPENLHDNGCPYCGDTNNGITYDDVPGKETDYRFCHMCSTSFRWYDGKKRQASGSSSQTGTVREAQKTSMKLDRTIAVRYTMGGEQKFEQYKNANQMWKLHPEWMTSAQEDTLTKKLYAAAKKGEYATIEINGRAFCLVNI